MLVSNTRPRPRWTAVLAAVVALTIGAADSRAQSQASGDAQELERLRSEVLELRRNEEAMRSRLEALEKALQRIDAQVVVPAAPEATPAGGAATGGSSTSQSSATTASSPALSPDEALDAALEAATGGARAAQGGDGSSALWSAAVGPTNVQLLDVSMDTIIAGGGSTASDDEIGELQGGSHDPNRNGFTLQQAELSFMGAVDPYLTGEAHIVASADHIELEEAFLQTTSLPWGLQLEAGYFLTEFGRINPRHSHAWEWVDQPVINTRLFGGEGLRSAGFRLGWLAPLPWYSEFHFGMQNANNGDLTASFNSSEASGGRPAVDTATDDFGDLLYLARAYNSWDVAPSVSVAWGLSGLYGPNSTGDDGQTWIYGTDLRLRWRPTGNFRGWPFLTWQTEFIKRDYTADWFVAGTETAGGDDGHGHDHGGDEDEDEVEFSEDLPADILRDWGGYTQLLWGLEWGWAAGLRFEYAGGLGDSVIDGSLAPRSTDPMRADRFRLSPLLVWQPTHFSRLRLQYNYDWSDHFDSPSRHTVWLSGEISYGQHPAHEY
jgi:hypothetical protein